MRELTLDQVKEIGRTATCHSISFKNGQIAGSMQWIFADGHAWTPAMGDPPFVRVDAVAPQRGWQHFPGCDCEFCHE